MMRDPWLFLVVGAKGMGMNRRCKGEIFEEGGESNVSVVLEGITGGRETEGERERDKDREGRKR